MLRPKKAAKRKEGEKKNFICQHKTLICQFLTETQWNLFAAFVIADFIIIIYIE